MASHKPLPLLLLTLSVFFPHSLSLNSDGSLLLAFRYNILTDPLSQLQNWNYLDLTPCSWTGVTCDPNTLRVTRLSLPGLRLLGPIASELGQLDFLNHLDLSNNLFNGSLPSTLFNSSHLLSLSLSNNVLSGDIPANITSPFNYLNLSDNALAGPIPRNLSDLRNLTVLSLKGNYFSGDLSPGFGSVQVLDLSSNLFNGSVPSDIGGAGLTYLNLSNNNLFGGLTPEFGTNWPVNATIDLSYNNLTGPIPDVKSLVAQKSDAFAGNPDLCGKPLKDQPCVIPSTISNPPNGTVSIPPAIAVIPRPIDSDNSSTDSSASSSSSTPVGGGGHAGLKPVTIVGITVADLAGIGLLGLVLLYLYQWRKRRAENCSAAKAVNGSDHHHHQHKVSLSATPSPATTTACCCLKGVDAEAATMADGRTSSDSDGGEDSEGQVAEYGGGGGGRLTMVDGETEMEMETLMKASAYILGASGSSIVYKAVLQDGTTFAVRRLGEGGGGERLRREGFESQVRAVAKLRHLNVVRVRGFYWGSTEKLVISDFVSNGSLASISSFKKNGSSPCHLSLEVRLKIARGVARGLTYIHDKKFVHGNLKPSNILLTQEMEPVIGDLGISWIINGCKGSGSGRQFGSKRAMSMTQYDASQDPSISGSPYISPLGNANGPTSPYQAPELLKSLKATPKWDVYSFGVILIELLTGKEFLDRELGQCTPSSGLEDKYWALRMADVAIKADVQSREEAFVGVFKLGFQCANMVPQKRPSMKEALQVLEKVPVCSWQMI